MSLGNQVIYKQLLERHGRIRVPMIQRDYAQGRPAETEIREEFLKALKDALIKAADDSTLPLNLDFIYGSVEGDGETRFLPLDGQQRLTTLFLLHWYLAWKDDQWAAFEQLFLIDDHARFAYSVRPSSNEFFDQLVSYHPSVAPEDVTDLTHLITDQPWYFRSWRLDPTIQAVLYMLDAIHEKFVSSKGLFQRLIDETQPAITFQLLDLENFGLSDDLYIKMNARGKPLTAFETFKTRYEQELKGMLEGTTFDIGGQPFCASEYFARRMDTTWADLFWKLRDRENNLYDEALMNVFRAVALVTRKPDDVEYLNDISMLRNGLKAPSYTDFHSRKWLDEQFTLMVIHLLDSWSAENGNLSLLLPDIRYFDEKIFFDKIVSNGANLAYTEILQFAAYSGFIVKHRDAIDADALQEWLRIIHNLSVNTGYNRTEDLRRSIRGLNELFENSGDVLRHFAQAEKAAGGFNAQQIAEEKFKAELILANDDWRTLIDRAESHGYFRGQIEFLLDFSGALTAREELEPNQWDATFHTTLQKNFLRYLSWAEKMFSAKGLDDLGEYRWQRALLSIGDYMLPKGRNYSFLVDSVTDEASWKRLLRGPRHKTNDKRKILQQLWDRFSLDEDIPGQLDDIINSAQDIESWREALVRSPEAVAFCESKYIRREGPDIIYLLKRSQMNGYHAELFTYCLHQKLRRRNNDFTVLKSSYESVTDSYSEPHILLSCKLQDIEVAFKVYYQGGYFRIKIAKTECGEIANLNNILIAAGLSEVDELFQVQSRQSDIEACLKGLDETLHTEFKDEVDHA